MKTLMTLKDLTFERGDTVITTEGETGKIDHVCTCANCKARGFDEIFWINDYDESERYITVYEAQNGFTGYYRIGKYRFHDFEKSEVLKNMAECEYVLNRLKRQLNTIERVSYQEDYWGGCI